MLDKSVLLLNCVASARSRSPSLVEVSGLSRATTHRLAVGLEGHGLLRRTADGRFALGLHLLSLGRSAADQFRWPIGRRRQWWRCVIAPASRCSSMSPTVTCVSVWRHWNPHGLRTIVPVGAVLPWTWAPPATCSPVVPPVSGRPAVPRQYGSSRWVNAKRVWRVCRLRWSATTARSWRRPVSGPTDRMGTNPGERLGDAVSEAALAISTAGQNVV
ncbi:MAG: helix-turn-helix domain-containing protein [Microthrixaceae bacterium]